MNPAKSARLGLALSGGGFRASFFHLGVLRRLAELDLLRHVTTLSTVSGGSILAAHYYLAFRKVFETRKGELEQKDYQEIVGRVETEFVRGNAADLRNRLLMNPLAHIAALVTGGGYGRRMARLYTKHFFRDVTREIFDGSHLSGSSEYAAKGIPLHHAITRLPELAERNGDETLPRLPNTSSGYPGNVMAARNLTEFNELKRLATIPHFVINATCLNTGGPFQFMLNEIGGSQTGYIRYDELFMLLQLKLIANSHGLDAPHPELLEAAMTSALAYGQRLERDHPEFPQTSFKTFPDHLREHILLYQAAKSRAATGRPANPEQSWLPSGWEGWTPRSPLVASLLAPKNWLTVRHVLDCDFGSLRQAKVAAWYWLDTPSWEGRERRGGFTRDEYGAELKRETERIDASLVEGWQNDQPPEDFVRLVLDIYYLRSADAISWNAPDALRQITLSDAVAASANFPPVFTPFNISGLFDHGKYTVLSLTDGGVHDNQGIEAVIDDRCAYLIASDAGGLVIPEPDPPESRVPMMNRIIDVLMGGVRAAQMRSIDETCRVANLYDPETTRAEDLHTEFDHRQPSYSLRRAAIFHMTSSPLEAAKTGLPEFEPATTAHIRTDLDAFSEVEIAALRYQGYQLADRFARWYVTDSKSPFKSDIDTAKLDPPVDLGRMPDTADHILRGSALLAGRFTRVHPWIALALSVILATGCFAAHLLTWSQLQTYLDEKPAWAVHWLGPGQQAMKASVNAARDTWRDRLGDTSLFTIVLAGWALWSIRGHLWRKWIGRRKRGVLSHAWQRFKGKWWNVVTSAWRVPNLITLGAALMFVFTLRPKWLLGVLPLWSIVALIVFSIARFAFTPLWKRAGKLKPMSSVIAPPVFPDTGGG